MLKYTAFLDTGLKNYQNKSTNILTNNNRLNFIFQRNLFLLAVQH